MEQVARTMEMQIISSRWVVTEKSPQEFKARLVVRGFEEEVYPHSDSPTASRESFKTFLALAAIQIFHIKNMDVKSAFLQGTPLDREVYMEPPWELKKPGIVEVEENCVRSIRCLSQLVFCGEGTTRKFWNEKCQWRRCLFQHGQKWRTFWNDSVTCGRFPGGWKPRIPKYD